MQQSPDFGQETELKLVWPCLKVFWLSKDNSAGHSGRKKKEKVDNRRGGKTILRRVNRARAQLETR